MSGRSSTAGVQRWRQAQQEAVGDAIASGAAATGYVLAQLRKKHGKTMQQVAKAIRMTLSVYHRVEMASRIINGSEIDALAAFYGLTPEELIGLFEKRTQENLQQLQSGVPPEQLLPRVPRSLLKGRRKMGAAGRAGTLCDPPQHPVCRRVRTRFSKPNRSGLWPGCVGEGRFAAVCHRPRRDGRATADHEPAARR